MSDTTIPTDHQLKVNAVESPAAARISRERRRGVDPAGNEPERRPHYPVNVVSDEPAPTLTLNDVQSRSPSVALSLSRVGVTGVEKVIRLRQNGDTQLFSARFECVVDLGGNQK